MVPARGSIERRRGQLLVALVEDPAVPGRRPWDAGLGGAGQRDGPRGVVGPLAGPAPAGTEPGVGLGSLEA